MHFNVITIGSSLEDITFYTSECTLLKNKKNLLCQKMLAFEYGAKIKVDQIFKTFGGGAANTAVSFASLGLKVGTITSVGNDDRGKNIIKNLKKYNVHVNLIKKSKTLETGFSFLIASSIHAKEHVIFSNRGANTELQITNKDLKILNKKTDWIYLTSLAGNWKDTLKQIFSTNHNNIAWNIGSAQLTYKHTVLLKYLKKTHVLSLNKDEALELVLASKKYNNHNKQFLNNINNLLKIIKNFGPKIVLITSGRKGAHVFNGKKIYFQKPYKEKRRVDTTGVGDAFNSSFIAGLIKYGDIKNSLILASKNSANVIAKVGAQNGLIKL